ncbi:MAG: hypothetical protein R6X19_05425 [Kiritimatiellia bacterium]
MFLAVLAEDTAAAVRVSAGEPSDLWLNITGGALSKPYASSSMPAFALGDFSLSVESGCFPLADIRHALMLAGSSQNLEKVRVPSGSWIPRGAVADHIAFDGTPFFFPGTCNMMEQGGRWGHQPPFDNPDHFIHLAWFLMKNVWDVDFLTRPLAGLSLWDRLELAFSVPPIDPDSDLVICGESDRGANCVLMNEVVQTGRLLFASLLRMQAALEMEDLMSWGGDTGKAFFYEGAATSIRGQLVPVFGLPGGLLKASTGVSAQPDVWGTAFAVHRGLLPPEREELACRALALACQENEALWRGLVRPVPVSADFSPLGAWEKMIQPVPRWTGQNGAYWAAPAGWVIDAVSRVAPKQAIGMAEALIGHFLEEDFRLSGPPGAPWQCGAPPDHRQAGICLASAACPISALRRMGWMRG